MSERLAEIQGAIDRFHMEEARTLAARELAENPSAEAYYLAAQAALSHGQRVDYLERALELDPQHQAAAAELDDVRPPKVKSVQPTPEPAKAPVRLASLSRRFVALIIDAFAVAFITVAIMAANGALTAFYDAMLVADELAAAAAFNQLQSDMVGVNLLVSAVYNAALMTWLNGRTLGKLLLGMRVIKKNGRRISLLDALLRNVFGYMISQIFMLGYLWAVFDREKQAWHDKMAGTVVVDERPKFSA